MKTLAVFVFGIPFFLPLVADAASFVVSPASGSFTAGNTITLNIEVNPEGANIYTAMLDARFSSDTFEVVSFTLNDALLPLKQPGYDALNNTTGVLTKTGGFTGITTKARFGTVVLRAKQSGSGTFTVIDSSKLLDGNNIDQQLGTQTSTYTIVTAPIPEIAPSTPTEKNEPKTQAPIEVETDQVTEEKIDLVESVQAETGAEKSENLGLVWTLILMLLTFTVGYFAGRRGFKL